MESLTSTLIRLGILEQQDLCSTRLRDPPGNTTTVSLCRITCRTSKRFVEMPEGPTTMGDLIPFFDETYHQDHSAKYLLSSTSTLVSLALPPPLLFSFCPGEDQLIEFDEVFYNTDSTTWIIPRT
ncbi:hypothetical protein ACTFIV_005177 [Dictyostelium citrinum]